MTTAWLTVTRGDAPLVIGLPHTGTAIAADLLPQFVSPWLARRDADWWIDRLYGFAAAMGATVVHTAISRSVIDANRDPSGVSLYPGQVTTGLCPTETFDGEALYRPGLDPDAAEIERRRIIVAAIGLPIPKLINVMPLAETLCIGLSSPMIGALSFHSENRLRYLEKLVNRMNLLNSVKGRPV